MLEAPLKGRVSEVTLHTLSFVIAFTIITFLHIRGVEGILTLEDLLEEIVGEIGRV